MHQPLTRTFGVYRILNTCNGDCYIGSTVASFGERWRKHREALSKGRNSRFLQHAWDKYGADAFRFEVLETVEDASNVLKVEQLYLDTMKPKYNICRKAGSRLGVPPANKGLPGSPHPKRGVRQDRLCACGKPVKQYYLRDGTFSYYHKTCGARECRCKGMTGRHHSSETKMKISASKKGER